MSCSARIDVLNELTSSNFLLKDEVCSKANMPNGKRAAMFVKENDRFKVWLKDIFR